MVVVLDRELRAHLDKIADEFMEEFAKKSVEELRRLDKVCEEGVLVEWVEGNDGFLYPEIINEVRTMKIIKKLPTAEELVKEVYGEDYGIK
jgi:hypothetical protein